jgi:RND superfamily putative drug exporter
VGQFDIKQLGVGFTAAILVDAFIIRTVLVPAAMHVLGRANWWEPAWLDRLLPHLHVEPAGLAGEVPPAEPIGAGSRRP